MKVIVSASEMKKISEEMRRAGKRIGFVPTMGALHEGHLALFRDAQRHSDILVVSLFVNPTQFNDKSDYEKYPRDEKGDLKKCQGEGVDIVFCPTPVEIYPPNEKNEPILLPPVALPLEGLSRPGHFDGVVNVVSRLFKIVQPHLAVFGLKDYQQFRVIQEMVREKNWEITLLPHPIERTPEGLALSSRNARLSRQGLATALVLSRSLKKAESLFLKGERNIQKLKQVLEEEIQRESAVKIDSIAIVDAETLQGINELKRPALVSFAVFIEGVRLIDNCILKTSQVRNP